MNQSINFKQRKSKLPATLIKLMKRSDEIHNQQMIVSERDYLVYDHLIGQKTAYGAFDKLTSNFEHNFECRTEVVVKNKDGKINHMVIHYITNDKPSSRLTIIDLDCMYKAYDDEEHSVVHAISYIRPIKQLRFDTLLKEGTIKMSEFNVIVEITIKRFEMQI